MTSWQLARAERLAAIDRDGQRCVLCGHSRRDHLTAHHLRPRVLGGPDRCGNLVTICRHCHDRIERLPRRLGDVFNGLIVWLLLAPFLTLARLVAPLRWRRRRPA